MKVRQLKIIANNVRSEMEAYVRRNNNFVNTKTLATQCGICSYLIFDALSKMGEKPVFNRNQNHCYITINGFWVDVTLRQFTENAPLVYVRREPYDYISSWAGWVHKPEKTATDIETIKMLLRTWPEEQNPFKQELPTIPLLTNAGKTV